MIRAGEYRAALASLDLTQVGASRLLGVNEATSRRWATHGATGIAAILLHRMIAGKVSPEDIEAARSKV